MRSRAIMVTVHGYTYFYIQRKVLFFWRYVTDGRNFNTPKLFTTDEMNEYMKK